MKAEDMAVIDADGCRKIAIALTDLYDRGF
jgi:hypothetical protein